MFKAYYSTLKPERTYANVMTTAAGFLLASRWHIDWQLLAGTILGTTLIVLSACAVNNCTDRKLDARMPRTKKRPLATAALPVRNVAVLAVLLGIAGFIVLSATTNVLTVVLGVVGFIDYVVLYAWSKRHTPFSTLIGTISGSVPMMAGYTAVTNHIDSTALLLGLLMLFWQMAHFYSISIFRHADYKAGDIPVWAVVYGDSNTRYWIIAFTLLFGISAVALSISYRPSVVFIVGMAGISGYWLYKVMAGVGAENLTKWSRGVFGYSLLVMLVFSLLIAVAPKLV